MIDIILSRLRGEWTKSYVGEVLCKGKKVLDVGCGNGDFLLHNPREWMGLDCNPQCLANCHARGLHAIKGCVVDLPFPDAHFDVVTAFQVIEHVPYEDAFRMLREAKRVLKPDGLFIFSTEMVTDKFWNTFSHVRPYPPGCIRKVLNTKGSQENEEAINKATDEYHFVIEHTYYYTTYSFLAKLPVLGILATLLAHYLAIGRGNYTMILKKTGKQ